MKVLDLFSGIGGFSLGLEAAGMETIAFCEFDKHAQKILKKHWPNVPIFDDVRTLDAKQYKGTIDVVCGGFPCQDLSQAGKQKGIDGKRSRLYRDMLRIISECEPRYAIFENVTGLLTGDSGRWFGQFLYDLAKIGYDAEWHCISAAYVGLLHKRDRVWVVAYPTKNGSCRTPKETGGAIKRQDREQAEQFTEYGQVQSLAKRSSIFEGFAPERVWAIEPDICRVVDGIPDRLDRLERLGNAVVPKITEIIGRAIMNA